MNDMRYEPIFLILIVLLIPILIFVAPNVYAVKHLSNAQRYSDGYANGGKQASTDFQNHQPFNLTCDPTNHYTTGGGHTGLYCNGWTNGYTASWNNLVQANPGGQNGGTTHETQPGVNNITSERYNIGFRDGAIQAKNDFNNGTKSSNLSCGLTLPQPMLAFCVGHFDGYKNQYIKLEGAAANVPTSNPPTTNVPTSNTTSNPLLLTRLLLPIFHHQQHTVGLDHSL
jgi:hypothetical protein